MVSATRRSLSLLSPKSCFVKKKNFLCGAAVEYLRNCRRQRWLARQYCIMHVSVSCMSMYLTGIDINVADAVALGPTLRLWGTAVSDTKACCDWCRNAGFNGGMHHRSSPVAREGGSAQREICLIKWQVKGRSRARQWQRIYFPTRIGGRILIRDARIWLSLERRHCWKAFLNRWLCWIRRLKKWVFAMGDIYCQAWQCSRMHRDIQGTPTLRPCMFPTVAQITMSQLHDWIYLSGAKALASWAWH